ncbi:hypothetical protein HDU97_009090 [Phlyctochytrium planicorne]|nr:hypothetical protein HDU97_009090 [Phlyctochytrium planicorne]
MDNLNYVEPDLHMLNNHPIKNVRLCGLIVSKDEREKNITYLLDDGTGLIPCVWWFDSESRNQVTRETLPLGSLVNIAGKIAVKYQERKIHIHKATAQKDPNAETRWWTRTVELYNDAYAKPSIIPENYGDKALEEYKKYSSDNFNPLEPIGETITRDVMRSKVRELITELESKLEPITMEDFAKLVSWYIIANMSLPVFMYKDVRNAPELGKIVALMAHYQPKVSSERYADVTFQKVFAHLTSNGTLYIEDEERDCYALIRHDYNLGKAILKIIRSPVSANISKTEGVVEEIIVMLLHNDPKFKNVSRHYISKSIKAMVEASLIYETSFKVYKAFD